MICLISSVQSAGKRFFVCFILVGLSPSPQTRRFASKFWKRFLKCLDRCRSSCYFGTILLPVLDLTGVYINILIVYQLYYYVQHPHNKAFNCQYKQQGYFEKNTGCMTMRIVVLVTLSYNLHCHLYTPDNNSGSTSYSLSFSYCNMTIVMKSVIGLLCLLWI